MQQEPRKEALGVHGSEHSEPTRNPPEPQRQLDPIDVFAPWATEDEKGLLRRIQRAQAAAQARAARSKHGRARTLYWWASQFAADWTFQRAPVDELQDVIASLSRTFLVAGAVERLEAPDGQ